MNYCYESYVYVLTAVRFATVLGCKDCTVVIGAAAGMVRERERKRWADGTHAYKAFSPMNSLVEAISNLA